MTLAQSNFSYFYLNLRIKFHCWVLIFEKKTLKNVILISYAKNNELY